MMSQSVVYMTYDGKLKRAIAGLAMRLGGTRLFVVTIGDRVSGLFMYQQFLTGVQKMKVLRTPT